MLIRRNTSNRTGFTLIEMTIVIGIIALLAALTLGISSSVMRNSEIRKTNDLLKLLTMAFQEYEIEIGRSMTFRGYAPVDGGNYDVNVGYDNGDNSEEIVAPGFGGSGVSNEDMNQAMELRMQHVVTLFMQSEGATELFSKILPDFFRDNTKQPIDAWGTPIGIVFPGRYFADVYPNGDMFAEDESGDQTVRDQAEDGLGSCMNRMPYFVSAGPDRTWGYRFQANGGPVDGDDLSRAIWEASHDNIYSYDPFIVENAQ